VTLSINDYVIDDCFRLVKWAERRAMVIQLAPFHSDSCSCRLCETSRWAKSPEAAEFVGRMR
jgi:hypothetical protein